MPYSLRRTPYDRRGTEAGHAGTGCAILSGARVLPDSIPLLGDCAGALVPPPDPLPYSPTPPIRSYYRGGTLYHAPTTLLLRSYSALTTTLVLCSYCHAPTTTLLLRSCYVPTTTLLLSDYNAPTHYYYAPTAHLPRNTLHCRVHGVCFQLPGTPRYQPTRVLRNVRHRAGWFYVTYGICCYARVTRCPVLPGTDLYDCTQPGGVCVLAHARRPSVAGVSAAYRPTPPRRSLHRLGRSLLP
eukprot:2216698-Rhodomonas_salina.5